MNEARDLKDLTIHCCEGYRFIGSEYSRNPVNASCVDTLRSTLRQEARNEGGAPRLDGPQQSLTTILNGSRPRVSIQRGHTAAFSTTLNGSTRTLNGSNPRISIQRGHTAAFSLAVPSELLSVSSSASWNSRSTTDRLYSCVEFVRIFERYVTKYAPHEALKLIADF